MKKGFTLLEVILAIFVLTVAISSSFVLIQQTLISASLVQSKLVAAYLAQEGIEIVKNIRDSNWLNQQKSDPNASWDEGLGIGDWEADYQDDGLWRIWVGGYFLNIDANGFYSYSTGSPTPFKRRISISGEEDLLKVLVDVQWTERGRTHQLQAVEHLYNWYGH